MILFKEDWQRYPDAIPDFTTTNKSALRLASIYKAMGVKNYLWPLALLNPELQGVDPHSTNLTMDQKAMVLTEVSLNPAYHWREIVKIPAQSGREPIQFRMDRSNMSTLWLYMNHISIIQVAIRQSGKTLFMSSLNDYLSSFRLKNSVVNFLTKDSKLRAETVILLKQLNNVLPNYLKFRTKKDSDVNEMYTVKALINRIYFHVSQASQVMARNAGRGFRSANLFADEVALSLNIKHSLPAALSAGTTDRDTAREAGTPWGTLLATTAGRKQDDSGGYIYDIIQKAADFDEKFFDAKDKEQLAEIIKRASRGDNPNLRVHSAFNHRSLGKTDEWLRLKIGEAMLEPDSPEARMDFLGEWFSGNSSSILTPLQSTVVAESIRDPDHTQLHSNGFLTRWYVPQSHIGLEMSKGAIGGLDTSDAIGIDDIAFVIRSVVTGAVIASTTINMVNIIDFSEWLYEWLVRYTKLVYIIERHSTGSAVLDYLVKRLLADGQNPFARLYNTVVDEKDTKPDDFRLIENFNPLRDADLANGKYKKNFGFKTAGSGTAARKVLLGTTLRAAVDNTAFTIYDKVVAKQLLALTIKNDRVDHSSGEHDDHVFAWLLGYHFLYLSKSLSYYGIDETTVLSETKAITKEGETASVKNERVLEEFKIRKLRGELSSITAEMEMTNISDIARRRLEARLRMVLAKMPDTDNDHTSMAKHFKEKENMDKITNRSLTKNRGRRGVFGIGNTFKHI